MRTLPAIAVGDHVRSYDFPGISDDTYMEGVVESVGTMFAETPTHTVAFDCPRYHIRVTQCVREGVEVSFAGKYVFPPVNGTDTLFGKKTHGVIKMGQVS